MQLVNETSWKTSDLKALLRFVQEKGAGWGVTHTASTILRVIPNTYKKEPNKYSYRRSTQRIPIEHVVVYERFSEDYDDTYTLKVGSPNRLGIEVLDRIADAGGHGVREIPLIYLHNIADAMCQLLFSRSMPDYTNAEDLNFRKGKHEKTDRRPLIERQITALGRQIEDIQRNADYQIREVQRKINKLRSKL